jgi:hypothetical protein
VCDSVSRGIVRNAGAVLAFPDNAADSCGTFVSSIGDRGSDAVFAI